MTDVSHCTQPLYLFLKLVTTYSVKTWSWPSLSWVYNMSPSRSHTNGFRCLGGFVFLSPGVENKLSHWQRGSLCRVGQALWPRAAPEHPPYPGSCLFRPTTSGDHDVRASEERRDVGLHRVPVQRGHCTCCHRQGEEGPGQTCSVLLTPEHPDLGRPSPETTGVPPCCISAVRGDLSPMSLQAPGVPEFHSSILVTDLGHGTSSPPAPVSRLFPSTAQDPLGKGEQVPLHGGSPQVTVTGPSECSLGGMVGASQGK